MEGKFCSICFGNKFVTQIGINKKNQHFIKLIFK